MSPLTNPRAIHRLIQLSTDLCAENRARCAGQLVDLYHQRQALAVQRQKRAERYLAEMAELTAMCEAMGLDSVPAL